MEEKRPLVSKGDNSQSDQNDYSSIQKGNGQSQSQGGFEIAPGQVEIPSTSSVSTSCNDLRHQSILCVLICW